MKFVKRLVMIAVVVGLLVGYKFYSRVNASGKVEEQAKALVEQLPGYETNRTFYDSSLEKHHDSAFRMAYKMGGRRTSASFDDEHYFELLVGMIQGDAGSQGMTDLAASLAPLSGRAVGLTRSSESPSRRQ